MVSIKITDDCTADTCIYSLSDVITKIRICLILKRLCFVMHLFDSTSKLREISK